MDHNPEEWTRMLFILRGLRRFSDPQDVPCIICQGVMGSTPRPGVELAVTLPCNHSFGYRCLCSWLRTSSTCPTCRMQLFRDPSAERREQESRDIREQMGAMGGDDASADPSANPNAGRSGNSYGGGPFAGYSAGYGSNPYFGRSGRYGSSSAASRWGESPFAHSRHSMYGSRCSRHGFGGSGRYSRSLYEDVDASASDSDSDHGYSRWSRHSRYY